MRLLMLAISAFFFSSSALPAQDLERLGQATKLITDTTAEICTKVETAGKTSDL